MKPRPSSNLIAEAEVAVPRTVFAAILRRIDRL
jgi:hypothetical protein